MWWLQRCCFWPLTKAESRDHYIEFDKAVKGIGKLSLHADTQLKDQLATVVPWQTIHFAA